MNNTETNQYRWNFLKLRFFRAVIKRIQIEAYFSNNPTQIRFFRDKVVMVDAKLVIREITTCVKFGTIQKIESLLEIFQLSTGRRSKGCGLIPNQKVSDKRSRSIGKLKEQINLLVKEENLFQFQDTSTLQELFERFTQSGF